MRSCRSLTAALLIVAALISAIVLGSASADSGDSQLTATWNCCGAGGAAAQDFIITSTGGSLTGTAKLPDGRTFANITGSHSGTAVTITTTYTALLPGYVATFTGTLASDASSITGSWSDSLGQSGAFTATRSAAFVDPLPVPEAGKETSRVFSLQHRDGKTPATGGTVTRDGKTYPLTADSRLQTGDIVHTDANSVLAMEFLIGGRVGMNTNATVEMTNERSVTDRSTGSRSASSTKPSTWLQTDDTTRGPLEIQTNGGVLSGLRG